MIEETIRIGSDVSGAIAGLGQVESAGMSMQQRFQGIGGTLTGLGAKASLFTAPLALGLGAATQKAISFDTAMSGASRALDLSTKETEGFAKQIKEMAPALGMTPIKMAELATEAGKLGVAKENMIGFAKVVAEIAAITDLTAEQTQKLSGSFAALQTITGANTEQLNIYGAAVNKLDDSIGGTTPAIIEFTRQTAAAGKLLKLDIKDLAAYGATMQALGIQNGVAYRTMNSLLTKLAAPQVLSKDGQKALEDLGISSTELSKLMTTNANAGIKLFLDRINEVSRVDVSKAMGAVKQVIGADFGDEVLTLAASTGKLDQALAAVSDTMDQANLQKKTDELAKKLGNVKGQQAIATAQLERLAITIGAAVLPSFNSLLALLVPLASKFAEFAESNPGITKVLVAIASIAISAGPVLMVLGSIASGISAIMGISAIAAPVIGVLGGAIAFLVSPIGLALVAVAALGAGIGLLIANWDQWGKTFTDGATKLQSKASQWGAGFGKSLKQGFDQAQNGVVNWWAEVIDFWQPSLDLLREIGKTAGMLIAIPFIKLATWGLQGINLLIEGVQSLINLVTPPLTALSDWVVGLFAGAIAVVSPHWNSFTTFVSAGFQFAVQSCTGFWNWMIDGLVSNWIRFMNWFGQAIQPLLSLGQTIGNALYSALSGIWDWIKGFVAGFFNAGVALAVNFGEGIKAQFYKVVQEFQAQLDYMRKLLPGSEPKVRSPLSNLADAGRATLDNFASGFSSSGAIPALSGNLGAVRSVLSSSGSDSGAAITVNDNRTINLSGAGGKQDIIELLRQSDRELLDLISKAQQRWNRGN